MSLQDGHGRAGPKAPVADAAGAGVLGGAPCPPFRRHVRLSDGTRIVIRDVRRGDRRLIEEGFRALSPRSRFLRFHGAKATLTDEEIARLADPAGHDDVALGALGRDDAGRWTVPVGIGRFVRLFPGGPEAELALTVVDRFQGRGAGTRLLEAVSEKAAGCGVSVFFAHVRGENAAMQALARRFGADRISRDADGITYRLGVAGVLGRDVGTA